MNCISSFVKYVAYCLFVLLASFGFFLPAQGQTPSGDLPKVVFIGDYFTAYWENAFGLHPNWVNKASNGPITPGGDATAAKQLAAFQANVVSLHPAAVHIMLGTEDAATMQEGTTSGAVASFLSSINSMVHEASAANIKVFLGIEPYGPHVSGPYIDQINAAIAGYGAAHGIPVINYGDAVCGCVGSTANNTYSSMYFTQSPSGQDLVTKAGYVAMLQLAESVMDVDNLKLEAGWLSNYIQDQCCWSGPAYNVNTVVDPDVIQFTPVGYYSDGSHHPILNTTYRGTSGWWASSNPEVVYVSQTGRALALSPGTATISYTGLNGAPFASWVMYVK